MEKCRFCGADLEENSTVCPQCQKDNGAQPENVPQTEEQIAEKPEEKAAPGIVLTPGKLAAVAAVFVVLVAVIIALIVSGQKKTPTEEPTTPADILEATEAPTIPADGNPEDVTCKGTYTAADADVVAAARTVIATMGDEELTNEELQIMYWSEVWQFLSQYGSYAAYFGLDPTTDLDTQACGMMEGWTWQQMFLDNCLKRWQESKSLTLEARKNGFTLDAETQASLDGILEELNAVAVENGIADGAALLVSRMGAGATTEAYRKFQENQYIGYGYFAKKYAEFAPDDEEIQAYFTQHAGAYEEQGLTRDTRTVDIRHVLVYPEGAASDTIRTEEFPEEAWAAGEAKAQELYNQWLAGEATEESFAALANAHSEDPGSSANGGLYQGVNPGEMVEEFDAWCFDSQRQVGDTGIVKTMFGYHIMYFSGSRTVWQDTAKSDLISEKADAYVQSVQAQYPIKVDYSKILLAKTAID